MEWMFNDSEFNQPIGDWDVSNVRDMRNMFNEAAFFNQDISKWNIHKDCKTANMFERCEIDHSNMPMLQEY